jgi:Mce-associated membrane protein
MTGKSEVIGIEPADVADSSAPAELNPDTSEADELPPRGKPNSQWARRVIQRVRTHLLVSLLAVAFVSSAASAALIYQFQFHRNRQIDSAASDLVLRVAKDGTVAILSYSPERLDQDFAAAKAHLTGGFLSYYSGFTEQIVAPAAKQKQVTTKASVIREAITEMNPESATVLVFIDQVATSKDNPDGAFTASSVKVGMTKVGAAWLISSFDPL